MCRMSFTLFSWVVSDIEEKYRDTVLVFSFGKYRDNETDIGLRKVSQFRYWMKNDRL